VLWREFVALLRTVDSSRLFSTPFDPADPIGTPRGFAGTAAPQDPIYQALRAAVKMLDAAKIAPDVRLGDVQFAERGGRRIPLHGGLGDQEGIANFVNYAPNTTTLDRDAPVPPLVPGSRTLRGNGYPINRGSSFVMAVTSPTPDPGAARFSPTDSQATRRPRTTPIRRSCFRGRGGARFCSAMNRFAATCL
jgi:acyl-homoserine-lactone acylase